MVGSPLPPLFPSFPRSRRRATHSTAEQEREGRSRREGERETTPERERERQKQLYFILSLAKVVLVFTGFSVEKKAEYFLSSARSGLQTNVFESSSEPFT